MITHLDKRIDKQTRRRISMKRAWHELKQHWFIYLGGIVVPFVAYAIFIGYPLIDTFRLSFYSWNGLKLIKYIGWENYKTLFRDPNFIRSLVNNLKWTVVTLLFPVVGGLLLAIFLNSKKIFGSSLVRALLFLPCTMSLASIGLMFSMILNPAFGGLNEALKALGLEFLIQGWLDDPKIVIYTLALVFSWSYIGICMMLFHAGISQIDPELHELATLEGANPLQRLWYVTLPMIRPVFIVVTMLCVMSSLKTFDLVYMMTKGGPFKTSNVLAYFMYLEAFHKFKFGYGASISVMILLLSSIFIAIYLRNISREAFHVD
jgi:ABC-type sugar transport system permease subunit